MNNTRLTGNHAEDAVCSILERRGYRILARNYVVHNVGELDIVAESDNEIFVFEVKSRILRKNNSFGSPEAAVTYSKQRKIYRTALYFIEKHGFYERNVSFLAVSARFDKDGLIQNVEFIPF